MDVIYTYNTNPRNPHSHLNCYLREALRFNATYTYLLW